MAASNDRGKITKSTKANPSKRELSSTAVAQINALSVPSTPAGEVKQEKRQLQGVVINGKTYTCAICKSGHRVGVCKHARERPMKATHPPGRPAAGAPKKVVCDCPKGCKCSKKDCKCPRQCACTQSMYMLVYIPGPGEEGMENPAPEEERGRWELGKEVITDLKGNVLSPEEVRDRKEQKDAQKTASPANSSSRPGRSSTLSSPQDPASPSDAKPEAGGGCCRHKQAVQHEIKKAVEQEAAESLKEPSSESSEEPAKKPQINTATHRGCNCGSACRCAFCPEHSGNKTSHDMLRQQIMHFSQHQHFPTNSTFTTFNTTVPQSLSCMGGQPRFALSRYPAQPSFANFGQAFPTGGRSGAYMIAYPMHRRLTPLTPIMEPQNPMLTPQPPMPGMLDPEPPMPIMHTPVPTQTAFDFADYDIGEAFVASDGPHGWQQHDWQGLVSPDVFTNFDDQHFNFVEENHFNDAEPTNTAGFSTQPSGDFLFSPTTIQDPNGMLTPLPSRTPSNDFGQSPFFDPSAYLTGFPPTEQRFPDGL